ncbi:MAG TPA: trypsin-like peptidase domain-containing protein [Kofleriaceae bacterium]|nr:trypsin-like peptidase domain-containing protein [Kofleriaceae bacterium]
MRRAAAVGALWLGGLAALLAPALAQDGGRQEPISLSLPSVVLVLAVDARGGELEAVAAGSGTIVSEDGAVLTNHHVLYDAREARLYDLFLIARDRGGDRDPEVTCAGVPVHGELRPDLDLAIIRCEKDLGGQPRRPENWPGLPLGDSRGIVPGEQLWVLGYPSGSGSIRVSAGLVSGWTGEQGGTASRAFMRTDALITGGNSGGAAVDRHGRLLGVPTAFRVISAERGEQVSAIGKVGLIRPIEAAKELLEVARVAPEKKSAALVTGSVSSNGNGRPIPGAFVLALPGGPGASAGAAPLAWGSTDASGRFTLAPALPRGQRYTIAVTAPGFRPAIERDALTLPDEGLHRQIPWRNIRLVPESR